MQSRTWALRWRNPALCKRLLRARFADNLSLAKGARPLEFNLAWLERWAGNFEAASTYADAAFEKMNKSEDPEGWVEIMVAKAVCAYSLGNHNRADEILKEAYGILGPATHTAAGIEVLSVLAILAKYSGTFDKARECLDLAMRIAKDRNLYFEPARILQVQSRIELVAGNTQEALRTGYDGILQAKKTGNFLQLPYAHEVYCAALVECHDFETARRHAQKGIEAAVFSDDLRVTCQLHYEIGNSYLKEQRPEHAIRAFQTGLKQAKAFDYHLWVRNFHFQLSRTYELHGAFQGALDHLKIYTDMQAEQFTRESQRQSNELRSQLEVQLARRSASYERKLRDQSEALNKELVQANSALRDLNERMQYNALHDALTGIGNRRLMNRFFSEISTGHQSSSEVAALLIDLDGFKKINDQYGHEAGDEVIIAISSSLQGRVREEELLARMGGDEFLIASLVRTAPAQLIELARSVIQDINRPLRISGETMKVGASIGISVCAIAPNLERRLLTSADAAMYQAKRSGKNQAIITDTAVAERGHAQELSAQQSA